MRKYYYYYLKDPDTAVIRYIGITLNPKERYQAHLYNSHKDVEKNKWKSNWIKSLLKKGVKPVMEIFDTYETACVDDAYAREERFINEHFLKGTPLVNVLKVPHIGGNLGSNRKPIYQYDKNTGVFIQEFPSISDASRELKCSYHGLHKAVKKVLIYKGYGWSCVKQDVLRANEKKTGRPSLPHSYVNKVLELYNSDTTLSTRVIEKLCKRDGYRISRESVRRVLRQFNLADYHKTD